MSTFVLTVISDAMGAWFVVPASKVPETDLGASITTSHSASPVQSPDHPVNPSPAPGDASSPTEVPNRKSYVQDGGHEMPPGSLVTEPLPVHGDRQGLW